MAVFYRKAILAAALLIGLSAVIAWGCLSQVAVNHALLPAQESEIPWGVFTTDDRGQGGESYVRIKDTVLSLDYDFFVSSKLKYPYASLVMDFSNGGELTDISGYTTLTFKVWCQPQNVLTLVITTREHVLQGADKASAYRIPTAYFSCDRSWKLITVDLHHLAIPHWWQRTHNIDLSDGEYDLGKMLNMAFGFTVQSVLDTPSSVQISELTLHKNDWRYVYILAGILLLLWGLYLIWLFRLHARAVLANARSKMQSNRPLVAYQQLSVEAQKDKETSAILRFLATEYADPELNLERALSELGVNRNKLNDTLKEEIGMTFSAYLNKLRLTEAARVLLENASIGVSEVAYKVGYSNVSYFNKLFKTEYGCTPKMFRSLRDDTVDE